MNSFVEFIAHVKQDENGKWAPHLLEDHLRDVAEMAKEFAEVFHAGGWAELAGLWHDLGKYSNDFQKRIRKKSGYKSHVRFNEIHGPLKRDHATAGALHISQKLQENCVREKSLIYHLITHAIAGHHGGLPDWHFESDAKDLKLRLGNGALLLEKVKRNQSDIPTTIFDAPIEREFKHLLHHDRGLLIRMIFSCLIDADRLDTEYFHEPEKKELREITITMQQLHDRFMQHLEEFQDNLKPEEKNSDINKIRSGILENCLQKTGQDYPIFSLTVPTGGGKTLSSMAFALTHAIRRNKRRIIYVIPYTSIIEQNAAVFKKAFGNLSDTVLEHHCNFDFESPDSKHDNPDDITDQINYTARLATENWNFPVIVTTNVQFFESLFSAHPSACRKLHNIANSIVVLDEIQLLPPEFLNPILTYIHHLSTYYGVTFVFSSATQPAFKPFGSASFHFKGLENIHEIVDNPDILHEKLKGRVSFHFPKSFDTTAVTTPENLADRLLEHTESTLCIVNTKAHARRIFQLIRHKRPSEEVFHLSTRLCAVHRSQIIQTVKQRLEDKLPCLVVSTQLVEAGVDLDFPVVYRAMSGLDSIAQAAGRCNRENKNPSGGNVYIFILDKNSPEGHLQSTEQAARLVLKTGDFTQGIQLQHYEDYFKELFWSKGDGLDKHRIESLLQDFNFREASRLFKIISEETFPVVVPHQEKGQALIDSLEKMEFKKPDFSLLRKAQPYSVSLYQHELQGMLQAKIIKFHPILKVHYLPSVSNAHISYQVLRSN